MTDSFVLLNIAQIKFESGMTFKHFLRQFQPLCSKLLCVVFNNNTETLVFYDKKDQLPKNTKFHHHDKDIYTFIDLSTVGGTYSVFGYPAACTFYPNFDKITDLTADEEKCEKEGEKKEKDEKDEKNRPKTPVLIEYIGEQADVIKVIHDGRKMEYPKSNKLLEVKKLYVF